MAEDREVRLFREAYLKGSKNPTFNELMAIGEWELNTGGTLAQWEELPTSDRKLRVTHYDYKLLKLEKAIKNAILSAFSDMTKPKTP